MKSFCKHVSNNGGKTYNTVSTNLYTTHNVANQSFSQMKGPKVSISTNMNSILPAFGSTKYPTIKIYTKTATLMFISAD